MSRRTVTRPGQHTQSPPAGAPGPDAEPAPDAGRPGRRTGRERPDRRSMAWWLAVGTAALVVWAVLTWPLAVNLDEQWRYGAPQPPPAVPTFHAGDNLQTVVIYSVMVDNLRELREPYLDLREGAAGPAPLRTTSLDLPWTLVVALLWPLTGLAVAYNLVLLLSSVAAALAAFGLLRRHTRWTLLAAAGALLYAAAPHRMLQLVGHFGAVMWWAFPLVAWAFEVMMERWRAVGRAVGRAGGRRGWARPAVALAAVALTVGLSGELHHALFMVGLLTFLAGFVLLAALFRRERPPWPPAAVLAATAAAVAAYALLAFGYVFGGEVDGGNGSWREVVKYAAGPKSLVLKLYGLSGEGLVYVGWPVVAFAVAGVVACVAGRRRGVRALPYAVLLWPVLFFTFGPRLGYGPFLPYRWLFDNVGFLSFQRVPQRLMVLTMLVILVLAVVGVDWLAGLVADRLDRRRAARGTASPPAPRLGGKVTPLAAALTVVATLAILVDYRVGPSRVVGGETGNEVVRRLAATGDAGGPILGLPIAGKASPLNSATTYVAALSRRRSINAYNQTPAPWLTNRLRILSPLNRGEVTGSALAVLRETGTRQLVVINEPGLFETGRQWQSTIDALIASGHFRLEASDPPMALLSLTR